MKVDEEIAKEKTHIVVEIVDYVPKSVVSRTILRKTTGNISVNSFDAGEELAETTSPFDCYMQLIDGKAILRINDKDFDLRLGDGIIVPAHSRHRITSGVQFKMLVTVIKSGYEL